METRVLNCPHQSSLSVCSRCLEERLSRQMLSVQTVTAARLSALECVAEAAREWWLGKRPVGWTDAEHQANPRINCVNETEAALALAVAAALDVGGVDG